MPNPMIAASRIPRIVWERFTELLVSYNPIRSNIQITGSR
jgi:hypothetical protein